MSSSVDRFIQLALGSLQRTLQDAVQQWLANHPVMAWLAMHPWISVALLGLAIILLWGLLGAIARLAQSVWLGLLRLPFWMTGWLLLHLGRHLRAQGLIALAQRPADPHQRLMDLTQRLDVLRQEQDAVLAEVRSLLDQLPSRDGER
jgi:hypothetical protein